MNKPVVTLTITVALCFVVEIIIRVFDFQIANFFGSRVLLFCIVLAFVAFFTKQMKLVVSRRIDRPD